MTSDDGQMGLRAGDGRLDCQWNVPKHANGIVIFADDGGGGRDSSLNRRVARRLDEVGLGTFYVGLDPTTDGQSGEPTDVLRNEVGKLADRLVSVARWFTAKGTQRSLSIGYFAAGRRGSAALVAASRLSGIIDAVVSFGGRPDIVGEALGSISTSTLLIGREENSDECGRQERAAREVGQTGQFVRVSSASDHVDLEDHVAQISREWFAKYMWRPALVGRPASPRAVRRVQPN